MREKKWIVSYAEKGPIRRTGPNVRKRKEQERVRQATHRHKTCTTEGKRCSGIKAIRTKLKAAKPEQQKGKRNPGRFPSCGRRGAPRKGMNAGKKEGASKWVAPGTHRRGKG